MQEVTCPHCRQRLEDDGTLSGQLVCCPHCGEQFTMPSADMPPMPIQTYTARVSDSDIIKIDDSPGGRWTRLREKKQQSHPQIDTSAGDRRVRSRKKKQQVDHVSNWIFMGVGVGAGMGVGVGVGVGAGVGVGVGSPPAG